MVDVFLKTQIPDRFGISTRIGAVQTLLVETLHKSLSHQRILICFLSMLFSRCFHIFFLSFVKDNQMYQSHLGHGRPSIVAIFWGVSDYLCNIKRNKGVFEAISVFHHVQQSQLKVII